MKRAAVDDLCRLLGLRPERWHSVHARIEDLGGLWGLHVQGSEALADRLSPGARTRLELLLSLVDAILGSAEAPDRIEDADDVARYFRPKLALIPFETFWLLMLDARGRPLGVERIAIGTLTSCLVHPREVFAPAIRRRAAQIIVVHNHPSGDPTPSDEDRALTERLSQAGHLLGIPLVDHVIVGRAGHRSLGMVALGPAWPGICSP